jgi:hypothetical protein
MLEELRLDVAWEARQGIADYIACRECGLFRKTPLWQPHLKNTHKLTVASYRALYPGARLISFAYIANLNAESGRGSTDVRRLMANFADAYFTGEQLTAGRADAKWEKDNGVIDAVMCRICGLKIRGLFRPHLNNVHKQTTLDQYLTIWPNAPTIGSDIKRSRMTEVNKGSWQRKQAEIEKLRGESEELRALREAGMLSPKKDVGGRPGGMSEERQQKARELLRCIQDFMDKNRHDDGSIAYAAKKAYPGVAQRTAKDRANKTLKDYRNFIKARKASAS